MTLGGMLKHLAYVEQQWFHVVLHDREPLEPWASVDWKADNDWDWHSAAQDTPDELIALWQGEVDRARKAVDEALEDGDLGQPSKRAPWRDGRTVSLRWILTHMVEEYSRHNGHADLIREAIDGQTGSEPPAIANRDAEVDLLTTRRGSVALPVCKEMLTDRNQENT